MTVECHAVEFEWLLACDARPSVTCAQYDGFSFSTMLTVRDPICSPMSRTYLMTNLPVIPGAGWCTAREYSDAAEYRLLVNRWIPLMLRGQNGSHA